MPRIPLLKPRVPLADLRRVKPPPKTADVELQTADWRAMRARVVREAGGKCQWPGCGKAERRMFVDHIKERRDGGAVLDRANLWCLCPHHHSMKTLEERAKRAGLRPRG
jgi:5-methylcytosine-specific restriction endonuclease McrA